MADDNVYRAPPVVVHRREANDDQSDMSSITCRIIPRYPSLAHVQEATSVDGAASHETEQPASVSGATCTSVSVSEALTDLERPLQGKLQLSPSGNPTTTTSRTALKKKDQPDCESTPGAFPVQTNGPEGSSPGTPREDAVAQPSSSLVSSLFQASDAASKIQPLPTNQDASSTTEDDISAPGAHSVSHFPSEASTTQTSLFESDLEAAPPQQQSSSSSSLVQAELAPDLDAILAERDELKRKMDSIPEAKAVARPEKTRLLLLGGGVLFCLVVLVVAILVGTATQQKDTTSSTNNNETDHDHDHSHPHPEEEEDPNDPFWKSKQVGQTILGTEAFSEFGEYLSISHNGTRVAAGGEEHGDFRGRVVVYQLSSSTSQEWQPLGQELLGDEPGEESGRVTLASSGNVLAIGGMRAWTSQGGEKSGHVRTFRLSEDDPQPLWIPMGEVLEGRHSNQRFGADVEFSANGTILSVGSMGTKQGNGTEFGSVQVFQYNDTTDKWDPLGQELVGDNESDFFGFKTALSANGLVVAVGGYGHDGNGQRSGIVRVYQFDLDTRLWNQIGQDFYGETEGDELGRSISLSSDGQTIAFGGFKHKEDAGRAYVYKWHPDIGEWHQMGQSIDGHNAGDRLGRSVFLSGDGSILATSAYWNADGGDRAGHVRVFYWNNNTWEEIGPPILGSDGDWFGRRISMSRDGKALAIGGPFHDSVNGRRAGKVQVYSLP